MTVTEGRGRRRRSSGTSIGSALQHAVTPGPSAPDPLPDFPVFSTASCGSTMALPPCSMADDLTASAKHVPPSDAFGSVPQDRDRDDAGSSSGTSETFDEQDTESEALGDKDDNRTLTSTGSRGTASHALRKSIDR